MLEIKALLIILTATSGPHYPATPRTLTQTATPFSDLLVCNQTASNTLTMFGRNGAISGFTVTAVCIPTN